MIDLDKTLLRPPVKILANYLSRNDYTLQFASPLYTMLLVFKLFMHMIFKGPFWLFVKGANLTMDKFPSSIAISPGEH